MIFILKGLSVGSPFLFLIPMKTHIRLQQAELELLNKWTGTSLSGISADILNTEFDTHLFYFSDSIFIHGEVQTLKMTLAPSSSDILPVAGQLGLCSEDAPIGPSGIQLPNWFIVKKTEVWAEKISNQTNVETMDTVCENTILIESESGRLLLLTPSHPEDVFCLMTDDFEIEKLLESDRFVLKHVFN
jgi:hypothetical protein